MYLMNQDPTQWRVFVLLLHYSVFYPNHRLLSVRQGENPCQKSLQGRPRPGTTGHECKFTVKTIYVLWHDVPSSSVWD